MRFFDLDLSSSIHIIFINKIDVDLECILHSLFHILETDLIHLADPDQYLNFKSEPKYDPNNKLIKDDIKKKENTVFYIYNDK
jgi:hypothetical protein